MRNGTTTTYTYDNNNRLISEVSSSQVKSYTYDANGNQLTAISNGNYAGAYTYDLWNMQATYTVDGTGITSYTYRPDGLRHSVQGKVHIWDNGNIIADIGSDTVYYIRALTLIYSQSGDTKTYYRFNGHGDVIALANANGAITKQYKYDAFGVEENPGVFDTNVFRYCAEYFDVETNTIYFGDRYYDALTGKNTSLCLRNADIKYRQTIESQHLSITTVAFSYNDSRSIPHFDFGSNIFTEYENQIHSSLMEFKGNSGIYSSYGCFYYVPTKGSGLNPTKEDNYRYKNCYSFAIGYKDNRRLDPREIRGKKVSPTAPVYASAREVCLDIECLGRHARILKSIADEIFDNEYRIAFRIDTSGTFDYHFMVQTYDGRWAEKKGIEFDSVLHDYGWTPENLPWTHTFDGETRYYDSEIIYIAVTR